MLRLVIVLVLLTAPASAFAQDVFAPPDSDLRIGQKVRVLVDAACTTAPCPGELVKGKLTELSATSIVVDDGHERRELAAAKIAFLERPRDRIWDGALLGFAAGFTFGFVSVMVDPCDGWFCGPGFASAVGLFTGGIGAGVGVVTDALMSNRRVVFARSPAKASPSTVPVRGISYSVRF